MFALTNAFRRLAVAPAATAARLPALATSALAALPIAAGTPPFANKGPVPLPIGGSTAGTTLVYGDYGIRLREGGRLTAKQLEAARRVIRRKIRIVKGSEMWLRVFPDVPVTSKGNETRMGKGKGTLDHYMCRVPVNRVVFEIKGPGLHWEVAKDALRQGGMKLPVAFEIVQRKNEEAKAAELAKAIAAKAAADAAEAAPKAAATATAASS
ncbi:ribosomal protein L16 [Allomyces macrogynus ATCC 38327]|uniref:Ribosomal protein L16 n=1 Tax=Allomyces macrogynus (strain ATCC 38327) TaxID=578462 RepID=A0A0L0SI49_ALLM3|nr:ribosomal protein L16 [Allomyces macrogynus ATCC 38327]|eukprot:KNE62015.1 ribosomal protein L16 [Allomyces macrogynus ATCC 38327]